MDPSLLFFGAIILVIVLMMVRNGRKRQKDQLALTEGLKPGAEIMTTFGLYGTILSIDDAENRIVLQTGPGSEVTIHRQALGRIVTPLATEEADADGAAVVLDGTDGTDGGAVAARRVEDATARDDAARGSGKTAD